MKIRDEIRRYSEEMKVKIVEEIESGKLSRAEACRAYSVKPGTLGGWLEMHGRVSKPRIVEVVMSDQKDKIEELQKALAEAHLKNRVYEELIKIAKEEHNIDLKKSIPSTSSSDYKPKGMRSKK